MSSKRVGYDVIFSWSGLPSYAIACLNYLASNSNLKICVFATRPKIPIDFDLIHLGFDVYWIDDINCEKIIWEIIKNFSGSYFLNGHHIPKFIVYARIIAKNSGRVIYCSDQNMPAFRVVRYLKLFKLLFKLRGLPLHLFVPGESSKSFYYPIKSRFILIQDGLYSCDDEIFNIKQEIVARPNIIVYVGQLNSRKNILSIVQSFASRKSDLSDWSLLVYGSGEYSEYVSRFADKGVFFKGFCQPGELPEVFNNARVFVLGSIDEHWGVVVHEASCCGCALALSKHVGSLKDLSSNINSVVFDPYNLSDIKSKLDQVMTWSDLRMEAASKESLEYSSRFSKERFLRSVLRFASS